MINEYAIIPIAIVGEVGSTGGSLSIRHEKKNDI
jgi:hypothetical protein